MIIRINDVFLDSNYEGSDGEPLQSDEDGLYLDIYTDGMVIKIDPPRRRIEMTPVQVARLLEGIQKAIDHHAEAKLAEVEKNKLSNWRGRDEY